MSAIDGVALVWVYMKFSVTGQGVYFESSLVFGDNVAMAVAVYLPGAPYLIRVIWIHGERLGVSGKRHLWAKLHAVGVSYPAAFDAILRTGCQ